MQVAEFPRKKGSSRGGITCFLAWWGCFGLLCLVHATFATSVQSLQHLLKHPHYADDGHQHVRPVGGQIRGHHQREVQQDHITTLTSTPESALDSTRTSPPRVKTTFSQREIPTVYRGMSVTTAVPRDFYRFVTGPSDLDRKQRKNLGFPPPPSENRIDKGTEDVREANKHYMKMMSIGQCNEPKPMVVRVRDYYPDPSKEYLPRCTLLHRCSDETGCCDSEELQCMPKAMQEVALSFYVIEAAMPIHEMGMHNAVQKLLFVNHTRCECLPKSDTPRVQDKPKAQRDDHRHHHHIGDQRIPTNHEHSKCRECPLPFFKREHAEGRCSCDCFDRQKPCIRIKRGREPLSEIERRCVETGKCHVPDCEFGQYDSSFGRCPKKPEDYQRKGGSGNKNHQNNHQRWSYLERD